MKIRKFTLGAQATLMALGAAVLALTPQVSQAQVFVNVTLAPPELPVYDQPPPPAEDYIWIPGYWAWSPDQYSYYWVPGYWSLAPQPGYLWTPGYWAFEGPSYVWHEGYWGPHVGYYGGINYGAGYYGTDYVGGRWIGGHFSYNVAITNVVGVTYIHNFYRSPAPVVVVNNHFSFNGAGGVIYRPSPLEVQYSHEGHINATVEQMHHIEVARGNRALFVNENHGRPPIMTAVHAGEIGHVDVNVNIHNEPHNDFHPVPQPQFHPQGHPENHENREPPRNDRH